jgi:hypothetical protein
LRTNATRLIELTGELRKYDMGNIRENEIGRLNLNLTHLKNDWALIKQRQQDKINYIGKVQSLHNSEASQYEQFVDYFEPGSL